MIDRLQDDSDRLSDRSPRHHFPGKLSHRESGPKRARRTSRLLSIGTRKRSARRPGQGIRK